MKNVVASAFLVAVFSFYVLSKPATESSAQEELPTLAFEPSSSSSEERSSSSASSSDEPSSVPLAMSRTPVPAPVPTPASSSQSPVVVPRPKPKPSSSSRAPASSAAPPPPPPASSAVARGQFADGTYTSPTEDAYYGDVQIQVTVSNGFVTSVQFLKHPSGSGESKQINSYAMPILKKEAISAQSGHVNAVSGATYTSQAFNQALASAIAQAKA